MGAARTDPARWQRDRALSRRGIAELLDLAEVREAIFLASPSLHERIAVWREDPDSDAGLGLEAALVKYLSRMAARCTPFGLFAGNSVGAVGREMQLEILGRHDGVKHTRLDMDFLEGVVAGIVRDSELRPHLAFRANSSLYEVGGALRYAEARVADGQRSYFLVDVEPHEPLRRALACARDAVSLETIAEAVADEDISLDVARDFVGDLIDAQLLIADLGPAVTGPESLDALIAQLAPIDAAGDVVRRLRFARDAMVDLDGEGIGAAPDRYRTIAAELEPLAPVDPARFVQVDFSKPARELSIPAVLVEELLQGVQALLDLFGRGRRDALAAFRQQFEARYGEREVALVEVLDEETGIGYEAAQHPGVDPSPLLAGLPFPPAEEEERFAWGSRARFLAWKLAETVAAGREEMVIEPHEVARFHDPAGPRLADAIHIAATLLSPAAANANGNEPHCVLDSAAGPSGARLLGRFCHGDPALRDGVEAHLRAEEALDPEVVTFEIVHLPEGRTGNILARPVLRPHELAFLGRGGAAPEKTLRLPDLTVRLEGGRIALRSRSLGCEVRPRLTSAHNTGWRSLGVYRFLAALQIQGIVEGIAWVWGPLESQPRLPRVRFGRLVLARQQWNGREADAKRLSGLRGHEAYCAVQTWRSERGVPRWVGLVVADNVLPIDLDDPLSVATFVRELRGRETFTLQEMFPGARPDAVQGPEGLFMNEVILPVVREAGAPRERVPPRPERTRPALAASFPPGSEWLTVKLYAGPAVLDRVLQDVVAPVVRSATRDGAIRRWFFLRFQDPELHLRVRMEGEPAALLTQVLPAIHRAAQPFRDDGRLHRTVVDSYEREVHRYGGERGVLLCEDIFHRDSEAVLDFLGQPSGEGDLDARWRFVFRGMDLLLGDLGVSVPRRHVLMRELAAQFLVEFHADTALRKGLRDRARQERRALENLLAAEGEFPAELACGIRRLQERSAAIAESCVELRQIAESGRLDAPLEDIAASLIHMHANRVFRSSARAHEMVLYGLLESAYDSQLARHRKAPS